MTRTRIPLIRPVLPVLAAPLILAGCFGAAVAYNNTFEVGAAPTVEVTNDNGEVRVTAGEPGSIEVVALVSYSDNVLYTARQDGDTVTVSVKVVNPLLSDPRADVALRAPPDTSVTIVGGNGLVIVQGILASSDVTFGEGHVGLTDVGGTVDVTTGMGRISVERGAGAFRLSTGNGDIVFKGRLEAGTESDLHTDNGSVTVQLDPPAEVELDAQTESGGVSTGLVLSRTSLSEPGRLVGTIGEGGARLRIRTARGDITVR